MCSKRDTDEKETERNDGQSAPGAIDKHKRVQPAFTSGQPGVDSQMDISDTTICSRTFSPTARIMAHATPFCNTAGSSSSGR